MSITIRRTLIPILMASGLILAACGSDDTDATDNTDASTGSEVDDTTNEDDLLEGTEDSDAIDGASMGDANATAAKDVEGADLASGEFELLDTRPEGYDALAGTATIARYDGTTITVELAGLEASTDYAAHLHAGPCSDGGGSHFMFDPAGEETPPNEIHLVFTSSEDGAGFMTAENAQRATEEGQSVVVHTSGDNGVKVACAQLT